MLVLFTLRKITLAGERCPEAMEKVRSPDRKPDPEYHKTNLNL